MNDKPKAAVAPEIDGPYWVKEAVLVGKDWITRNDWELVYVQNGKITCGLLWGETVPIPFEGAGYVFYAVSDRVLNPTEAALQQ